LETLRLPPETQSMRVLLTPAPYSLGKLIDWKQTCGKAHSPRGTETPPYSLGKLIDWKPKPRRNLLSILSFSLLPTR
jgi:hypothetical protein